MRADFKESLVRGNDDRNTYVTSLDHRTIG